MRLLCSHLPTDWKAKYIEVADMLAETRTELDDFQVSSRELEEELERELERTEKAQQELKVKAARAEQEKDEWKVSSCTMTLGYDGSAQHALVEVHVIANDSQHDNYISPT
jgi:hypothetical protein